MAEQPEELTWEWSDSTGRGSAQVIADDGFEPDLNLSIGPLGYPFDVKNRTC